MTASLTMSLDELIHRATAKFAERFGRRPRYGAFAPGRINLIGEHTDYNDGFVLPMAINWWAVVVADVAGADESTLVAHDLSREFTVDFRRSLAPSPPPNTWASHLTGVAHEVNSRGIDVPNLSLLLTSTVPIGAGLASSAAIEVAMATLLEQITGASLDPIEKAKICQRAEHEFVGTPCGIMDMLVSCAAVEAAALFIDCRSLQITALPWPQEAAMIVINTGVKHELAAGIYAQRRRECEDAARFLGVRSLRDATVPMIDVADLPSPLRDRALHVVTEDMRTVLASAAMGAGNVQHLGDLMFASHASLRELFEVSCRELDLVVDAAGELSDEGVFGARMTGGGFGGCAIVLCRTDAVSAVQNHISVRFEASFRREPHMFAVKAVGPAQSLVMV